MGLFVSIRKALADPRLKDIDYDSDELLELHRTILLEKKMMRQVFAEFYDTCMAMDKKYFTASGLRIEIGAGVSFFKKRYPEIVSTDIKNSPHLDRTLDAQNMDLESGSVRAIYGINCFHHFPQPDKFFGELKRVLAPGGGCVLIEPFHGPVAARFYKNLFDTETFDKTQTGWTSDSTGVMLGANQALSYIVFKRDLEKFNHKHPQLELVLQKPLSNYSRYLLSGGLNFRSLLPAFLTPAIRATEWLITPLHPLLGLHHVIVIRKKK